MNQLLDQLDKALTSFDWWYETSDDGRVYRRGYVADSSLQTLIGQCAEADRQGTLTMLDTHKSVPAEKRPFYKGLVSA